MPASARLTVTTGPDRGKVFDLDEELIHIGKGAESSLVLNDALLDARHVSIVRRNGRHAIMSPQAADVEVDGTQLPREQWIWLPGTAQIRLSKRTALEFVSLLPETPPADSPADSDEDEGMTSSNSGLKSGAGNGSITSSGTSSVSNGGVTSGGGTATKPRKSGSKKSLPKPGDKRAPIIATFITDQQGDTLVKLGEDGHYPELQLAEGQATNPADNQSKQANPLGLILAFVVSVGASVGMLFLDIDNLGGNANRRQEVARKAVSFYYGDSQDLEPYQLLLRQAHQARSQGKRRLEERRYRDVLNLLRAENKNPFTGLTRLTPAAQAKFDSLTIEELDALGGDDFWSLNNDDKLARLIAALLSNSSG